MRVNPKTRGRIVFATLFSSLCFASHHAYSQLPIKPAQVGRFTARFENGGLYLDFDGVPLLKGGVVQAFYSDSRQDDYGSGSNPPAGTVGVLSDGGCAYNARFDNSGEAGVFHADQSISVHPDGHVQFQLRARWDGARPASLEWNPIRLWTYPLVGADYSAETTMGIASGHIGRHPLAANYPANSLAPPWTYLAIRSPSVGEMEFTASKSNPKIAFDAREDLFLKDLKVLWIGDTGVEMQPGREVNLAVSFSVTPLTSSESSRVDAQNIAVSLPLKVETRRIANVIVPQTRIKGVGDVESEDAPVLIPRPKLAQFTSNAVTLGNHVELFLDHAANATTLSVNACHEFLKDLKHMTGVSGSVIPEQTTYSPGIHVGIEDAPSVGQASLPEEGYRLSVVGGCVRITGADDRGAFYGLQTLLQLLRQDKKGRFQFIGAEITDWPSLRFRGAHIFVGKNALPFHSNLIKGVLARYKLNELVIECEYTKWKSHPELWRENSMDSGDLAQVVAIAHGRFMEPIPLINTLGHAEWIFKNGVHLNLAEDEDSPHNYDPSNPDTYNLVFDVFGEALELFNHPRYFHIGHDEVKVPSYDPNGKYPARPANILKGAGNLFLEDANHLADWLRVRGAQPMMWGDMLLNSAEGNKAPGIPQMTAAFAPTVEEAARRRAAIPPDAVICDWRYEPGGERRNGLTLFEDAGHKAIGSAWFQPRNIRGWAEQAVAAHALGTLQTTWAGYDISESILETEFPQFSAYILAAENAWDGGAAPTADDDLPPLPDSGSVFRTAYRSEAKANAGRSESKRRSGWYISLRRAANINLFDQGDSSVAWSAYPIGLGEDSADTVDAAPGFELLRTLGGVNMPLLGFHPGGIMLQGAVSPTKLPIAYGPIVDVKYPLAVRLSINETAGEICFLQATGYSVEVGDRVATYTVHYADGSDVEIPIRYGYQTRALDDSGATGYSAAQVPWLTGTGVSLRIFRWNNPKPHLRITSIEFRTDHPYAAPIIFGITGVE